MKISELEICQLDDTVAYILGLAYPKIAFKDLFGKRYLLASINQNPGTDESLIIEHFSRVAELLHRHTEHKFDIFANKYNGTTISPKEGFSILIETDCSDEVSVKILKEKIKEVLDSRDSIKEYFIIGMFDGRSSWDGGNFFAIDVDKDIERIESMMKIIESFNIKPNYNSRENRPGKSPQLRIDAKTFMKRFRFLSPIRYSNYVSGNKNKNSVKQDTGPSVDNSTNEETPETN